jgi:flagellar motility protein MotE (MotC chaperone)
MSFMKSRWFLAVLALGITILCNTICMLPVLKGVRPNIEVPEEKVFENNSIFWVFRTREMETLIQNLRDKNALIAKKEKEISLLSQRLEADKEELKTLKDAIDRAQKTFSQKITDIQKAEKKNLKVLANIYAAMPPDTVVKVFGHMDDILLVKILTFMGPEPVGGIFQAMSTVGGIDGVSPDRVARLSELIRLRLNEAN